MGLARGNRAVLLFVTVAILLGAAAAVAVVLNDENEVPDTSVPRGWHEITEGEATRADVRERFGAPTRTEGSCLYYDDVVDYTAYRFCFRDGVLNLKAAY